MFWYHRCSLVFRSVRMTLLCVFVCNFLFAAYQTDTDRVKLLIQSWPRLTKLVIRRRVFRVISLRLFFFSRFFCSCFVLFSFWFVAFVPTKMNSKHSQIVTVKMPIVCRILTLNRNIHCADFSENCTEKGPYQICCRRSLLIWNWKTNKNMNL